VVYSSTIGEALELFFSHPFRYFLALILGGIFYVWMAFKKQGEELSHFFKVLFWGINTLFLSFGG
jgi:hypothetical protein